MKFIRTQEQELLNINNIGVIVVKTENTIPTVIITDISGENEYYYTFKTTEDAEAYYFYLLSLLDVVNEGEDMNVFGITN